MNFSTLSVTIPAQAILLVPIIPLLGALIVYSTTSKSEKWHSLSGWLATVASACSFAVVVKLFAQLNSSPHSLYAIAWNWFTVGGFSADFAFRFDNLSAVMCLIITGVGSLIHLYAIGYMHDDGNRPRFFTYLNLFLFSMLLLVLGDNLLVMFVGWEGVGLCSYLLIGFWFKDMENAKAGQKAFIVNRIGDAGFLLGMFTLIAIFGTVDFKELSSHFVNLDPSHALMVEVVALLLFVGAVGKSAQIPLYVWLPDAMAGPTPVSALIHAATMVTAGVYMIARMSFLYVHAPNTLLVISVVGALTAFFAATIALVQNDIKKVLAYSTVSQLGYMFMALGAGAFSNGIFHVVTHAFFKACLFMGAGSVIIGCHHEQDMRKFGGLWKSMPWTFITYFVATLAIAGIPFLSGFYSKDAILWTSFYMPHPDKIFPLDLSPRNMPLLFEGLTVGRLCWGLGVVTAFLTAFYMTRSLALTFFGTYRGDHPAHESTWVVTVPLVVLAALSAAFGLLYGETFMEYLVAWTREDMRVSHTVLLENPVYHQLEIFSIVIACSGFLLSLLCFTKLGAIPKKCLAVFPALHRTLSNKWWIDEIYEAVIIKPLLAFSKVLFKVVDRSLIDGMLVSGTALSVESTGEISRQAQSGRISSYALYMFLGAFVLIVFYLLPQVV